MIFNTSGQEAALAVTDRMCVCGVGGGEFFPSGGVCGSVHNPTLKSVLIRN